jgi:hypothetical protein
MQMVMLDCARRQVPVPALARWLLGLGITATLAANVAHGLGDGLAGAVVAAWPAVALVGSYELLMMIIRSAQASGTGTALHGVPERMQDTDPLQAQAALAFEVELTAGRVPSVRSIRARLHVGQPRSAGTHIPGRAQRGSDGCVPRRSGCRTRGSVGCLTEPPRRHREISAVTVGCLLRRSADAMLNRMICVPLRAWLGGRRRRLLSVERALPARKSMYWDFPRKLKVTINVQNVHLIGAGRLSW